MAAVSAGPRAPLTRNARGVTRQRMRTMVKYRWKAHRDLSIGEDGDASVEGEDRDGKANVITKEEYAAFLQDQVLPCSQSGPSYDAGPRPELNQPPSEVGAFPGGTPGMTCPPGEEPRESTCHTPTGSPCPRGGSSPGDGARGRV